MLRTSLLAPAPASGRTRTNGLKLAVVVVDDANMADVRVQPAVVGATFTAATERDAVIQRILRTAREHLGLDVAFVSQFLDGDRVFRYVDSEPHARCVEVGGRDPLEESYCHYVVGGSLPEFLPDPAKHPVSAQLAATAALGVGSHLSVPIRLSDGRVFGTFCCFALGRTGTVREHDLQAMRMLADVASGYLEVVDAEERDRRQRHGVLADVLADPRGLELVFQPLVDLRSGRTIAVEALARFPTLDAGPQAVFEEAWQVGLGVELEMKSVHMALDVLHQLPDHLRLGVNVSPRTLMSAAFGDAVRGVPPGRLAVEVTEHAAVDDYCALRIARQALRSRGIRLAIDDVGMGFSGLNHILESSPDTIKIDAAVIRGIHENPAKEAMVGALVSFGQRVDVLVVAEGIETADELAALQSIGVPVGQGYQLSRPAPLATLIAGSGGSP